MYSVDVYTMETLDSADGERQLKRKLIRLEDSLRAKYRELKRVDQEERTFIDKSFRPLVEPLENLVKKIEEEEEKPTEYRFKHEPKEEKEEGEKIKREEEELKRGVKRGDDVSFLALKEVASTPPNPVESLKKAYSTPEGRQLAQRSFKYIGNLVAPYLQKYLEGKVSDFDQVYGLRFDGKRWVIGDSDVEISDNIITVKGVNYNGTPGLLEYLFMKEPNPDLTTESDLAVFKNIVTATNSARRNYSRDKAINANAGKKYTGVIKYLFPSATTTSRLAYRSRFGSDPSPRMGEGMMMSTNRPLYEYWDDPNELVDRLRLLIASRDAGHSGHENEILSIIEELREAGYII
jgi:hypothetical protein